MNRSLGDGFPGDPACFQLESSPLARAVSQAVGPVGVQGEHLAGCVGPSMRAGLAGPRVRATCLDGWRCPSWDLGGEAS